MDRSRPRRNHRSKGARRSRRFDLAQPKLPEENQDDWEPDEEDHDQFADPQEVFDDEEPEPQRGDFWFEADDEDG